MAMEGAARLQKRRQRRRASLQNLRRMSQVNQTAAAAQAEEDVVLKKRARRLSAAALASGEETRQMVTQFAMGDGVGAAGGSGGASGINAGGRMSGTSMDPRNNPLLRMVMEQLQRLERVLRAKRALRKRPGARNNADALAVARATMDVRSLSLRGRYMHQEFCHAMRLHELAAGESLTVARELCVMLEGRAGVLAVNAASAADATSRSKKVRGDNAAADAAADDDLDMEALRDAFKALDIDGSGTVDATELHEALSAVDSAFSSDLLGEFLSNAGVGGGDGGDGVSSGPGSAISSPVRRGPGAKGHLSPDAGHAGGDNGHAGGHAGGSGGGKDLDFDDFVQLMRNVRERGASGRPKKGAGAGKAGSSFHPFASIETSPCWTVIEQGAAVCEPQEPQERTLVALEPCQLILLPHCEHAAIVAADFESVLDGRVAELRKTVVLGAALCGDNNAMAADARAVAAAAEPRQFARGQRPFLATDAADSVWVVSQGECMAEIVGSGRGRDGEDNSMGASAAAAVGVKPKHSRGLSSSSHTALAASRAGPSGVKNLKNPKGRSPAKRTTRQSSLGIVSTPFLLGRGECFGLINAMEGKLYGLNLVAASDDVVLLQLPLSELSRALPAQALKAAREAAQGRLDAHEGVARAGRLSINAVVGGQVRHGIEVQKTR